MAPSILSNRRGKPSGSVRLVGFSENYHDYGFANSVMAGLRSVVMFGNSHGQVQIVLFTEQQKCRFLLD